MKGFDPTDDDPDHGLTFDEWSGRGFWIKKGSKAVGFSPDGKALFTPSQVKPPNPTYRRSGTPRTQTHWEQSAARAQAKGTPWGVVEDFDSFVREAGMLPDLSRRPIFNITSPLEMHFMNVADKHGILDSIIDGDEDDFY